MYAYHPTTKIYVDTKAVFNSAMGPQPESKKWHPLDWHQSQCLSSQIFVQASHWEPSGRHFVSRTPLYSLLLGQAILSCANLSSAFCSAFNCFFISKILSIRACVASSARHKLRQHRNPCKSSACASLPAACHGSNSAVSLSRRSIQRSSMGPSSGNSSSVAST